MKKLSKAGEQELAELEERKQLMARTPPEDQQRVLADWWTNWQNAHKHPQHVAAGAAGALATAKSPRWAAFLKRLAEGRVERAHRHQTLKNLLKQAGQPYSDEAMRDRALFMAEDKQLAQFQATQVLNTIDELRTRRV